ncbi:putative NFX1-type zinc finger-containing protein 1-like [Trypanosoma theileri]|uniref:Putative NFX1-type zinc finger-containing protein 1-like n=1 Tax=Trypanosoma theileri TaxID=67003 RepID=A0A1X0P1J5_9TRYP|nr:putative NFX1-type zinc finger-containing protein 1-like [Trypanosoma theileri]ORC90280.1 putative NFX1-type zinc finger-containing protein 1-like [Trypanosoma theileri]
MPTAISGDPTVNAWTDAKSASINWEDPDDVLSNDWTFLRIVEFHPALAEYANTHPNEKENWQTIFMDPQCTEERIKALQLWLKKGLLSLREDRWCRHCGQQGHTRRQCKQLHSSVENENENENEIITGTTTTTGTGIGQTKPISRVMSRFAAHQAEIERCKLLQEKHWNDTRNAPQVRRNHSYGPSKRGGVGDPNSNNDQTGRPKTKKELTLFAEERRRGTVGRIDTQYGIGFVRVADVGDVKFFMDRVDYGIKEIALGDAVTLKIDQSRDYPLAVDIRPEKPNITLEDVHKFLQRCKTTTQPIKIIKTIMTHTYEWPVLLGLLREMTNTAFVDGVHTIVELTTFVGNREPIHIPLLESFLSMMLRSSNKETVPPFFPQMVLDALTMGNKTEQPEEISMMVERWIEVVNLVILLRQYANAKNEVTDEVQSKLISLLTEYLNSTVSIPTAASKKKVETALKRLQSPSENKTLTHIIPSADEFSVPPPDPQSPFSPQNLPINGKTEYNSTDNFITDHCRLLRADTFEMVSRLLPAMCFQLPHYTPSKETEAEIPHIRLYDGVRFMGRVLTRDRDYASPDSYILQVHPKNALANPPSQLLPGTTVCITTGLDRTVMNANEMFWGIITSCNINLLAGNMIVLTPCESSTSFDILAEHLQRNEELGKTDHSCILVTNIFMAGYKSIMKALSAFVGPLAMPLPMSSILVNEEAAANAVQVGNWKPRNPDDLVSYIPPYCEFAFMDLIDGVRDRFSLDKGQEEVMRCLPTSEILLVQGPPGTGKSFIGCRVVEVYVRYKQLVASGDILRTIDVDQLRSTSPDDMLPTVGPIVIITYKNHALDEFLIDLLKSKLWDDERPRIAQLLLGNGSNAGKSEFFPRAKRIVRIGGRSREAALDPYNLSSLIRAKSDKPVLNSLKERLFLMNQRLERLLKEIHYLESGRVPKSLFERWLTEEQRKHIRYEDRDDWLQGKQYVGANARTVERTLFLDILRTHMSVALEKAETSSSDPTAAVAAVDIAKKAQVDEDGGAPLSVFQEMRREEETRDFNDALHTIYLSAEAMHLAKNPPSRPEGVPKELLSLWSLEPQLRHEYYAYLIRECISTKARDCLLIMDAIMNVVTIRNHAMDELKLELLRGADVVGLTTTGCATNQNLLRSLRPSVLVVEEAAEVLESQLLACMTDSLQQVVLIGDHYQLQPKVETFLYEKVNKLNMSLFERLASRIKPIGLTEQRRMHPTISRMVRPFYESQVLLDNEHLPTRPFVSAMGEKYTDGVPGLAKRVFFWRHNRPEEEAPGSRSKVNLKEVDMVVNMITHLTSEGVHQKSITVITPYLGQCRMLRTTLRLRAFSDVAVSTVDLFQGDENDVIILSLVRTEKLTEFLRMRNRMIVCCSRARFAMVIVGNDVLLQQSNHWKQVLDLLQEDDCVGDRLPITRRNSSETIEWMEA